MAHVSNLGDFAIGDNEAKKVKIGLFADDHNRLAYRELRPDEEYTMDHRVRKLTSMSRTQLVADALRQDYIYYRGMKKDLHELPGDDG